MFHLLEAKEKMTRTLSSTCAPIPRLVPPDRLLGERQLLEDYMEMATPPTWALASQAEVIPCLCAHCGCPLGPVQPGASLGLDSWTENPHPSPSPSSSLSSSWLTTGLLSLLNFILLVGQSFYPVNVIMSFCNPVFLLLFHLQNCKTHFQHLHIDFTYNIQ